MINQKIDRVLFNIVQTLEDGKRSECIIKAYDYKRLKNILINARKRK